jgi:DNA polymerase (family 10)
MKNLELASALVEIADLTEIVGEESFKARAYRRAAESIAKLPRDIADYVGEGRLLEIPGVGPAIAAKIGEYLSTGKIRRLEKLRERVPRSVLELLEVPGLGPRTASVLFREAGITDLDGLEAALAEGKIRALRGMGEKKEQLLLKGVKEVRRRGARVPLGVAWPLAERVVAELREIRGVHRVEVGGGIRRRCETVGDADIVASTVEPQLLLTAFTSLPGVSGVTASGEGMATVRVEGLGPVDLRVVEPPDFVTALHHWTGSREHCARLKGFAEERGFRITERGVLDETGTRVEIGDEADIYRLLGMEYVPPELREDAGEIEAARESRLPHLVQGSDVRGDLHVHTDWTDGTGSVAEMARAAMDMGYQYIAVCDHSKSLGVAGGLDEEEVRLQGEEIDRVNGEVEGFRVLKGIEVEIDKNGGLDLDDSVLRDLDIVVAAVHSAFNMGKEAMTARIETALKNEHVDVLAHPTGRLIGRREPYELDVDRIVDTAAKTGTVLEINASPDRLDLPDRWSRRAVRAGCRLALNTDAHSTAGLGDMEFGVAVARRSWATPGDIVNTLSLDDLRRALRRGR